MRVVPYNASGSVVIIDQDSLGSPHKDQVQWAYHAATYDDVSQICGKKLLTWDRIWIFPNQLDNEISWLEVLLRTGITKATAIEMINRWDDDESW